jgi:hypothetical protein
MKLVVYDDLPMSSVHQRQNSLSSWINESRQLASRASTRASMSMKRSSITPLKISAPSDFRRVQSFQSPGFHGFTPLQPPASTEYQPLDLRIHRSGNRLSDLPSFDSFHLDESPQRKTLPAPPRPLIASAAVRHHRYQATSVVSRKPIGSPRSRSFGNLEPLIIKEPVRISNNLVPHFSKLTPVEMPLQEALATSPVHGRSKSEGSRLTLSTRWPSQVDDSQTRGRVPQSPSASKSLYTDSPNTPSLSKYSPTSQDPLSSTSSTLPSHITSLQRPLIPLSLLENNSTNTPNPSLSSRVTQWMFPTSAKPSPTPRQTALPREDSFNWERTRTLSGTTVASVTPPFPNARDRNNSSISSVFSSAITPRTSFSVQSSLAAEKDLDAGACHPTIFEEKRQDHIFRGYDDERTRYLESSIGVAF